MNRESAASAIRASATALADSDTKERREAFCEALRAGLDATLMWSDSSEHASVQISERNFWVEVEIEEEEGFVLPSNESSHFRDAKSAFAFLSVSGLNYARLDVPLSGVIDMAEVVAKELEEC